VKICCITSFRIPSRAANSIQVMKVGQALSQLGHEVLMYAPGNVHTPWKELAALYGLRLPFEVNWLPDYPQLKPECRSTGCAQKSGYDLYMAATGRFDGAVEWLSGRAGNS
jgi:hypothetical protein